jgi:hypothetical protein
MRIARGSSRAIAHFLVIQIVSRAGWAFDSGFNPLRLLGNSAEFGRPIAVRTQMLVEGCSNPADFG